LGIPTEVDIYIQVTDGCNALFGATAATGAERIGSYIDVGTSVVFVSEPPKVGGCKRLF
jgi:hypothetical protein